MFDKYSFYAELCSYFGKKRAFEFIRQHFTPIGASKLVSRQLLSSTEPDIRMYMAKDLYGPAIKPFITDSPCGSEKTLVDYYVLIPKEHVKGEDEHEI